MSLTQSSDFIYLDPPYIQTFVAYNQNGFDTVEFLQAISNLDAPFLLSNIDTLEVREIFKSYACHGLNIQEGMKNNLVRKELLIYKGG